MRSFLVTPSKCDGWILKRRVKRNWEFVKVIANEAHAFLLCDLLNELVPNGTVSRETAAEVITIRPAAKDWIYKFTGHAFKGAA